jgi:hypothetical protein
MPSLDSIGFGGFGSVAGQSYVFPIERRCDIEAQNIAQQHTVRPFTPAQCNIFHVLQLRLINVNVNDPQCP